MTADKAIGGARAAAATRLSQMWMRDWYSLEEAADVLCDALGREVSAADVVRYGIEHILSLSVRFLAPAKAFIGERKPATASPPPSGFQHLWVSEEDILVTGLEAREIVDVWRLIASRPPSAAASYLEVLAGGPDVDSFEGPGFLLAQHGGSLWAELCTEDVPAAWIDGDATGRKLPKGASVVMKIEDLQAFIDSVHGIADTPEEGSDPSDLPEELAVANQAFRAFQNGALPDGSTPKKRILAWIQANYPGIGAEALERIATVANPEKARGRPSRLR